MQAGAADLIAILVLGVEGRKIGVPDKTRLVKALLEHIWNLSASGLLLRSQVQV